MKNVLIISIGSSPAIVTETLWALHTHTQAPFPVNQMHIVTTAGTVGLEHILYRDESGSVLPGEKLTLLYNELKADIPELFLHIPKFLDSGNRVTLVTDMKSETEAVAYGDSITELVFDVTEDRESVLHLSIAGGRKTMSYHAGAAMTLYGRSRDRLSHTLIEPAELESCADFWWPTAQSHFVNHRFLKDENRVPLRFSARAGDARVILIDTPFLRARSFLPKGYFHRRDNYARAVQRMNAALESPGVVVNLPEDRISISGVEIRLEPVQAAVFAVLAQRAKLGLGPVHLNEFSEGNEPYDAYMLFFKKHPRFRPRSRDKEARAAVPESHFTKINAAQEAVLDEDEIRRFGFSRPAAGFVSINARPEDITLHL